MSEKLYRHYTPKDVLNFLGKSVNSTNEIDLLRNLKEIKEYYICDDGEQAVRGYFENIEDAVLNPNKFNDFISVDDEKVEFYWVNKEHIDENKILMESANIPVRIREEIDRNWMLTQKFEGNYRCVLRKPSIVSYSYSSCLIDNFSICRIYQMFKDIYSEPKKMARYFDILSTILANDDDGDDTLKPRRRGIDFSNEGVLVLNGFAFKVSDVQKQAVKSLYQYQLENKKGATNYLIFKDIKDIKVKKKQMANVISGIETSNQNSKFNIRECFTTTKDKNIVIQHFKIPDHW